MHTQYLHLHTRALPHPPRIQEESDDQRDRQSNDLSKEAKAKAMRVRHNNTGPRAVFLFFLMPRVKCCGVSWTLFCLQHSSSGIYK